MRSELDDLLDEVNDCFDSKTSKFNSSNKTSTTSNYPSTGHYHTSNHSLNVNTHTKPTNDYDAILKSPSQFSPEKKASPVKKTGDDLLDDLLNETTQLTNDFKQTQKGIISSTQFVQTSNKPTQQSFQPTHQCFTVYLGPNSKATSFTRPCEKLRCLTCDFIVQKFEESRWDETSDYYWFRNYIGNLNELKKKLVKSFNVAAYACQCSWRNIEEIEEVSKEKGLKWVCASH